MPLSPSKELDPPALRPDALRLRSDGGDAGRPPARPPYARIMLALVLLLAVLAALGNHKIRLRSRLAVMKLTGALPAIQPSELFVLLFTRTGFDLEALAHAGNPYATLSLPDRAIAGADEGGRVFATRCAQCHGVRGEGGHGPSLIDGSRRRSANDWGAFRVLRDGVPSTAMPAAGLSFWDTWNVIAHVRSLQKDARLASPADRHARFSAISGAEIAAADTDAAQWLVYTGGWSGRRNRSLPELSPASVGRMRLVWAHQFSDDPSPSQSTPVAVRDRLIVTSAEQVIALDQRSGDVLWRFNRAPLVSPRLCCTRSNRGVAVLGSLVFVGTLDAHLLALDLATGEPRWDVRVADVADGFSITNAPLVVDGRLIVGVGGGDLGARGFLDAYDPESGRRLWRFYTVPRPGEPGSETWPSKGPPPSGGSTWVPGAYDAERRLLYWGVGNPSPDYAPDLRPGDNRHTNSAIALDIETGTLRWSFQFTPNDGNDWDSAQIPVLVDAPWNGAMRPLLLWANRNGFFYVLDRATGEFLRATPFARQTWNYGFEPSGRPKVRPSARPSIRGAIVYPGIAGATSWWPASYSERLGLLFVAIQEGGTIFFRDSTLVTETGQFLAGRTQPIPGEDRPLSVVALDLASGAVRWKTPALENDTEMMGGLLTVNDQLVLGGQSHTFFALDAATGRRIWHANLGASIKGAPIVYRTDGAPRLAITAGSVLFVFEIPPGDGPDTR